MIKILPVFLFLGLFLFSFSPAFAAGAPPYGDEEIKKLITTLESDTARAEFVGNLKMLLEQQKTEEKSGGLSEEIAPLTEAIGVRDGIEKAVDEYQAFLDKNKLSSSLVHQGVATSILLVISAGFWFGVRRLSRMILRMIDGLSQKIGITLSRVGTYTVLLQAILKIMIGGLTVYTLGKIWAIKSIDDFFESPQMKDLIGTSFTVLFVVFLAALIWEGAGIYLSYALKQADDQNQTRSQTLLPIVRNIVFAVFVILFGLVLLSELGINVTPLLAGAGVIGVAVGFGAQSMVKDFITGFTIILEDLVRVGDVATLGGCTGVVEKITLRKVQLRDVAGVVYTIPFSEITTIQNLTKEYSFYVMDVGVSYNIDTDRVVDVLQNVDEELRADADYGPLILAPLEVLGVDRFADSAVIIKARIKTVPVKQWVVGREFNRRMKRAFDNEGIEIPFPQRVVTVAQKPAAS